MKKLILNISSSEKIEILNTEATIISIPDIDELRIKDEKGIKILSYNLPFLECGHKLMSSEEKKIYNEGLTESAIISLKNNKIDFDFILFHFIGFDPIGIKQIIEETKDISSIVFLIDSVIYHKLFRDKSILVEPLSSLEYLEENKFEIKKTNFNSTRH